MYAFQVFNLYCCNRNGVVHSGCTRTNIQHKANLAKEVHVMERKVMIMSTDHDKSMTASDFYAPVVHYETIRQAYIIRSFRSTTSFPFSIPRQGSSMSGHNLPMTSAREDALVRLRSALTKLFSIPPLCPLKVLERIPKRLE